MDDRSTNPPAPEPLADRHRGGSSLWYVWAFFLFAVVYPLSIGPAAKIYEKHPAARPAVETVYKPLTMLIDNSQYVRDLLDWYVHKVWRFDPFAPPTPASQTNSADAPSSK